MAVTSSLHGDLWHAWFGYVLPQTLTYLYNNKMVTGMPILQQLAHDHEVVKGALGKLHFYLLRRMARVM